MDLGMRGRPSGFHQRDQCGYARTRLAPSCGDDQVPGDGLCFRRGHGSIMQPGRRRSSIFLQADCKIGTSAIRPPRRPDRHLQPARKDAGDQRGYCTAGSTMLPLARGSMVLAISLAMRRRWSSEMASRIASQSTAWPFSSAARA